MDKTWNEKTWREKLDTPRKVIRKAVPYEVFYEKRMAVLCIAAAERLNDHDEASAKIINRIIDEADKLDW